MGNLPPQTAGPWYQGVTRYQWMVLAIASAGWVFDIFEGAIFGSFMHEALPVLLEGSGLEGKTELFINVGLAAFLAGGALGGLIFGMMADRWGRRQTMAVTILIYSVFTGLTALAQNWWQLTVLRFLVGMGVGGEWAVAAAVVAEVFPQRARPAASGIFHASSVLGTYLAAAAGLLMVVLDKKTGWRWGFVLGVGPALLILWVRVSMREPESWHAARALATKDASRRLGHFSDLFATRALCRHTLVATGLAAIGLATFWTTHFRGKDLIRAAEVTAQRAAGASQVDEDAVKSYETLGWFLITTGGGIGLLTFAPLSQRLGRRPAFVFFYLGGFVLVTVYCLLAESVVALLLVAPLFGFFTLGMHAGYAVYFPELYPTRLRGTGTGFCFNSARIVVVPVLLAFAGLQGVSLEWLGHPAALGLKGAMFVLGCLFLGGVLLMRFAPETRGQPLPE